MNEILKHCPFCGSLELQLCRTNRRACWVRCDNCGADSKSHRTRKQAIANWNSRPQVYALARFVEDDEADEKARLARIRAAGKKVTE